MAPTTITPVRDVIDALSRDSMISADAADVAAALKTLYPGRMESVRSAIGEMLADRDWSQDAGPYAWLRDVAAAL